jgi:outer membrane protein assembly factor BamB
MKLSIVKITIILTIMAVAITFATAQSDWEQFQKDDVNIGRTGDSAPTTSPIEAWSNTAESSGWAGIEVVPIVGNGSVFLIDCKGYVYSFNTTTGVRNWRNTTLQDDASGHFELATPAYDNDILYVATCHGNASTTTRLYALYTNNGTVKWKNETIKNEWGADECNQTNTPVLFYNGGTGNNVDDDRIFFGTWKGSSYKGSYFCYYAKNGTQCWNRSSTNDRGYYWAGATVIGKYLVYGDDNGNLTSVYWCNGTTKDELDIGSSRIRSSIVWNESDSNYGHIFFTNRSSGYVTRIGFNNSTGGSYEGHFNTSDRWSHSIGYTTSTPVVYNGKVYVGQGGFGGSGRLYCLYESNGSEAWNRNAYGGVQSSPALSIQNGDPYIYFTTNRASGQVWCVDKDNNIPQTEDDMDAWPKTPSNPSYTLQGVAISSGYIYFGNDAGYLFAYNQS